MAATEDQREVPTMWDTFWGHVADGVICLPCCERCDTVNWYPKARCRACGNNTWRWPALSGDAQAFVVLTVHRDFLGDGAVLPYTVALVEPVEHPDVRLLATVDPSSPPLHTGDRARLLIGERGGRAVVSAVAIPPQH